MKGREQSRKEGGIHNEEADMCVCVCWGREGERDKSVGRREICEGDINVYRGRREGRKEGRRGSDP